MAHRRESPVDGQWAGGQAFEPEPPGQPRGMDGANQTWRLVPLAKPPNIGVVQQPVLVGTGCSYSSLVGSQLNGRPGPSPGGGPMGGRAPMAGCCGGERKLSSWRQPTNGMGRASVTTWMAGSPWTNGMAGGTSRHYGDPQPRQAPTTGDQFPVMSIGVRGMATEATLTPGPDRPSQQYWLPARRGGFKRLVAALIGNHSTNGVARRVKQWQ